MNRFPLGTPAAVPGKSRFAPGRKPMKKVTLVILASVLSGCAAGGRKTSATGACPACPAVCVSTKTPEAAPLTLVNPSDLPLFNDTEDKKALLKAAALNLKYFEGLKDETPVYAFGDRKITSKELSASTSEFIRIVETSTDPADLDRQVKEKFDVYRLAGRDSTGTVLFSSYYEPTLEASLNPTEEYRYPIYARPDDLITVNLGDFSEKFKGEKLTGRLNRNNLVPYLNREEIDFGGALDGKGLELAWFRDRADIMDLHIEGSGRLALPDGRVIKAYFSATNSLKFKGWLTALVESGALPREGLSHEKGKQYLLEHPEKEREVMSQNKRYTFFRLEQPADPEEGPTGTYGLPLTGWRSIAVDNAIIPMGAIAFMSAVVPDVDTEGNLLGKKPDTRFVFCQDTGGAIKGPGRVDFFAGNGKRSRTFAFKLWDPGTLHLLMLKEGGESVTGNR
jgi:membrane-bound lytic murein transglycosylase A